MKIQIVSFNCLLKNKLGKIISSTFNKDILTGGDLKKQELAALSVALQNLKKGEKRKIILMASEAYGYYDPNLVLTMPRNSLPQVNTVKLAEPPIIIDVDGKRHPFRVTEVTPENIVLDGNHPLAGQDLVFEIETLAVRDATPEEISGSKLKTRTESHH